MRTTTQPTKPTTLLVDDNVVNLRLLQLYCGRRQIPYRTTADGQQALRLFSKHRSLPTPAEGPLSLSPTHIVPFELIPIE
jgi:CheY-like chemotaxis protein